ncbi:bacteriohemerythrin [Pseudodesulfovibrio sp.]|nr:bacteriohemerythrin [Pseudodesulfovibrio sp.]
MKKIEWNSKLNLGVPQIDEQHRRLVQLANNLVSAIQTNVADDILEIIFKELQEYTVFHFRDEELYMHEAGYPDIEEHIRQHEDLKKKVADYQEDMRLDMDVSPSDVLEFLGDWLVEHIIYSDMKIARFVKGKEKSS